MDNSKDYHILIEELKSVLQHRKLTYKQLSLQLEISEVTLKRIFAGQHCNVKHLISICDALGVSFLDLIKNASDAKPKQPYLTHEQETYLADHVDTYLFFVTQYYQLEGDYQTHLKRWGISKNQGYFVFKSGHKANPERSL